MTLKMHADFGRESIEWTLHWNGGRILIDDEWTRVLGEKGGYSTCLDCDEKLVERRESEHQIFPCCDQTKTR